MKVVTFRETMLRLAPKGYYRLAQAGNFGATYGGGEADVAVSLANFGIDANFITKLPKHDIGQSATNSLRRCGMNVSKITRGGDGMDIYFLEKDASQRPSEVIYDHAGSAIATAQPSDFNWGGILKGVDWLRLTGITPTINDSAAAIYPEACKAAKCHNVTVSCDLNYRKNPWSREKAGQMVGGLMEYVNVCISNGEDTSDVFGVKAANTDITGGKISHEGYREVTKKLVGTFHSDKVAITLRGSISASGNNWAAMLYDDGDHYFSKNYLIRIVDHVGGGDSSGGGLIYSLPDSYAPQDTIEFAVTASCLKHSIEGDFSQISVDEANKLAKGDGSGRVQR